MAMSLEEVRNYTDNKFEGAYKVLEVQEIDENPHNFMDSPGHRSKKSWKSFQKVPEIVRDHSVRTL